MKHARRNNTRERGRQQYERKKTKCASVMSGGRGRFAETMKQFINVGIESREQKGRAFFKRDTREVDILCAFRITSFCMWKYSMKILLPIMCALPVKLIKFFIINRKQLSSPYFFSLPLSNFNAF